MSEHVDLEVIEAAEVTALPVDEHATAFFNGTVSIYRLIEDVVRPVVQGQVGKVRPDVCHDILNDSVRVLGHVLPARP